MIEVRGIARRFVQGHGRTARAVQAVDGLDWVAADGCISGLLGPNGAGKTTLLRIVAGLVEPDAGQVLVDGIDVATQRAAGAGAHRRAQRCARAVPAADGAGEHRLLRPTAWPEPGHGRGARATSLARTLQMEPLLQRRTEGFSQGERMKTALARALVHDPHNIILDEPTNGLDVPATRALREALRRLRDEHGKCIVFSTHLMQEVERLCDQVLVMAHGRAVAQGHGGRAVRKDRPARLRTLLRAAGLRRAKPKLPRPCGDQRRLDGAAQGAARCAARSAHAADHRAQFGGGGPAGAAAAVHAGGRHGGARRIARDRRRRHRARADLAQLSRAADLPHQRGARAVRAAAAQQAPGRAGAGHPGGFRGRPGARRIAAGGAGARAPPTRARRLGRRAWRGCCRALRRSRRCCAWPGAACRRPRCRRSRWTSATWPVRRRGPRSGPRWCRSSC